VSEFIGFSGICIMPDYQCEVQEEEVIHRNNTNNNVRKVWLQNRSQNSNGISPGSMMDTMHENRTELQVSPSGRCRTALTFSQNVDGDVLGRQAADDNDSRIQMPPTPFQNGCIASNLNLTRGSFLYPFASSGHGDEALSVVSGYQHCAAEALRYLVEEENLSPDDPLVTGLRQHLSAQERQMNPESVLKDFLMTTERTDDNDDGGDDDEEFSEDEADPMSDALVLSLTHLTSAYLAGLCHEYKTDDSNLVDPEVWWHEQPSRRVSAAQEGVPSPTPSL